MKENQERRDAVRAKPALKSLYARAQKPALRILVGGALMVPAAAMMAGDNLSQTSTARDAAAEAAEYEAALAASQEMVERERELVVASFAAEFRIPVPLAEEIHEAAVEEKIAPRVAFGLVKAESSFRTKVVSPVGAVGLTQLLPSTAKWLVPGTTRNDLLEPKTNLRVGFKYLHHLIERYEGNEKLALTAYNRGPGTVSKLVKRGADPDNGYAEKVLTGDSKRHVALMNAKFGPKAKTKVTAKAKAKSNTAKTRRRA